MAKVTIPMNDTGYNFKITVMKSATEIEDLSPYTVTLKAWHPGAPGTLIVNTVCPNDPAVVGLCLYPVTPCSQPVKLVAEIELSSGGTVIKSSKPFEFERTESG